MKKHIFGHYLQLRDHNYNIYDPAVMGHDGAFVESITFNRRVVGSTPALAVQVGILGKSFTYSCMCASAWNCDTVAVL